jgi:hypothetical protein
MVDELAAIYMTTYFDVSRLTVEQIANLQKDGQDLRRFRQAIVPIAESIPDIPDVQERRKRLVAAAKDINKEWQKYKKSLPRFAMDAILDITEAKFTTPDIAREFLGISQLSRGEARRRR